MVDLLKVAISDFSQGLNTNDMAHEIGLKQSPDMQNVDVSKKGRASTRSGIDNLNTTEITSATGIYGAFYGKSLHFAAALTDVYKLVTGVYQSVKSSLTSNSETHFIEWEYDGNVYWVNGNNAPQKYISSAADITGVPASWTSLPPDYVCSHENRLWALRASTGKLDWCALENSGDWTTDDDAGTHTYGATGTGIVSQKSGLIVFRTSSIHKVSGKTPISFSFPTLYKEVGCIAPRSIVNIDNRIFFLGYMEGDYGVYALDDSGGLTLMSKDITTTLNTINSSTYNKASAINTNGKYKLSFPISSGWREVSLNYLDGSWEFNNGNAMKCYYKANNIAYGGSISGGWTYTINTGTDDNGTAINAYVKTRNYLLEGADYTKRLKWLIVWAKASGNWNLNINFYVDDKLYQNTYPMQLGTISSGETMRRYVIPLNADIQGNMIAVKFSNSTINQSFELYKAILYYEIKKPTDN